MNEENETLPSDEEKKDDLTEDLTDLLDSEEEELPPPEDENEAREINVGNIIGVGMIGILVIVLIIFLGLSLSGKKNKKVENPELDKAGTKTEIDFKIPDPANPDRDFISDNLPANSNSGRTEDEIDVDEVLNTLPLELQPQSPVSTAPVSSVGSRGGYQSERPDTRNSKSPRKIEGIAGLDFSGQQQGQNLVSQIMSGNFGTNAYGQRMTKEEFIAQQMLQTQNIQNQLYGNGGAMPGMNGNSNITGDKDSFFNAASNASGRGEYLSNTCLWDGTIISGALITAINTDNPGVVIARVTENVYSSYDHSYLLIPEGSLLFATYNSSISYGQKQVQVAWNLLIRPDNYRVQLGNMNGVNAQGASGYTGSVSNHPFETLKALGMVAVFSIIQTEITNDINSQNNEYLKNSMTDVYSEASKLGNKILDKALDIKPTIKIKEGTEIKLITNVPLELPPVEVNQVTQKYVRTR